MIHYLKKTKQNCGEPPDHSPHPWVYVAFGWPCLASEGLSCLAALTALLAELFLSNVLVSHILCPGSWQWEEGSLAVLLSMERPYEGVCSGFYVCACELGWGVLGYLPAYLSAGLLADTACPDGRVLLSLCHVSHQPLCWANGFSTSLLPPCPSF